MMLGFADFKNEFVTRCSEGLAACTGAFAGSGVAIEEQRVTKAQLGELTGLIFRAGSDSCCAPTLYAEDFYRLYKDGHSMEELSMSAVSTVSMYLHQSPDISEEAFEDRANLRIRLLNREHNKAYLENVPHYDHECGLSLIADIRSGEFRAVVNDALLDSIGISEEELFETAAANSAASEPPVLFELSELLTLGHDACENLLERKPGAKRPQPDSLCLLSNRDLFWGAAALFYPGIALRINELLGGAVYVLPSSVHEVLLFPASEGDPERLADIVRSANRSVVNEDDFLSDDIYICEEGRIRRIDAVIPA